MVLYNIRVTRYILTAARALCRVMTEFQVGLGVHLLGGVDSGHGKVLLHLADMVEGTNLLTLSLSLSWWRALGDWACKIRRTFSLFFQGFKANPMT